MRAQGIGHPFASLAFITELPEEWPALDPFLNGTDLPARDEVFLTHLMSEADWEDLELELNLTRPDILITLGPAVTRACLGDIDMNESYGTPYTVGGFVVFPAHAPAEEVEFACDMLRLSLYLHPVEVPAKAAQVPAGTIAPTPLSRHPSQQPRLKL